MDSLRQSAVIVKQQKEINKKIENIKNHENVKAPQEEFAGLDNTVDLMAQK